MENNTEKMDDQPPPYEDALDTARLVLQPSAPPMVQPQPPVTRATTTIQPKPIVHDTNSTTTPVCPCFFSINIKLIVFFFTIFRIFILKNKGDQQALLLIILVNKQTLLLSAVENF